MSIDEYFSTGPTHERPVFDAVMRHLQSVGPVHADVVSVGIFLKNPRKFAELRPMQKWVAVSFSLTRRAQHRTITRKVIEYGGRYWHTANVSRPEDVDESLCDLLTEAYSQTATGDSQTPGAASRVTAISPRQRARQAHRAANPSTATDRGSSRGTR